MYYIVNNSEQYYAGKCVSDNRTPVWKSHYTRALQFEDMKTALNFAKSEKIFFLGIEWVNEDCNNA